MWIEGHLKLNAIQQAALAIHGPQEVQVLAPSPIHSKRPHWPLISVAWLQKKAFNYTARPTSTVQKEVH